MKKDIFFTGLMPNARAPGLYRIRAILGKLDSCYVNTEIKTGEITTKAFHFGKETQ